MRPRAAARFCCAGIVRMWVWPRNNSRLEGAYSAARSGGHRHRERDKSGVPSICATTVVVSLLHMGAKLIVARQR